MKVDGFETAAGLLAMPNCIPWTPLGPNFCYCIVIGLELLLFGETLKLVLIFFCCFWFALLRMKEDLFCDLAF